MEINGHKVVYKKVMKLNDPMHRGRMICRICGSVHESSIMPGGRGYHYGNWQCDNGCKFLENNQRYNGVTGVIE